MNFVVKVLGGKSNRYRTLINLLRSLAIKASGVSNTVFLPSDPDELYDILIRLLQEKHAGDNSIKINGEIFAIVNKLLKQKGLSKKHQKQKLINCKLSHKKSINTLIRM